MVTQVWLLSIQKFGGECESRPEVSLPGGATLPMPEVDG